VDTTSSVPRRSFGALGAAVSIIGQGTFLMEHDERTAAVAALRRGLDLGMSHVDCAELYGDGLVEELVAEAIRGRRQHVFLVSKVEPAHASREGTVRACEQSLRRLGTDHLDCYLLHWPGRHPLQETVRAFDDLERDGKIRSFGVSNFGESQLEELFALVGPGRIACNQIFYALTERSSEHTVIPWCEAQRVAVVGYTPFGRARFPPERGAETLRKIAEAHAASVHQVALAFLTRRPSLFAIPKAARVSHVVDNARGAELDLTAAELAAIAESFPVGPPRSAVARI